MLVALPCGRDSDDLNKQTIALKSKFIDYLTDKQVAGIINLEPVTDSSQQYVLHFFPPCDFSNENIQLRAPDLFMSVADIHHLMLLIMPAWLIMTSSYVCEWRHFKVETTTTTKLLISWNNLKAWNINLGDVICVYVSWRHQAKSSNVSSTTLKNSFASLFPSIFTFFLEKCDDVIRTS